MLVWAACMTVSRLRASLGRDGDPRVLVPSQGSAASASFAEKLPGRRSPISPFSFYRSRQWKVSAPPRPRFYEPVWVAYVSFADLLGVGLARIWGGASGRVMRVWVRRLSATASTMRTNDGSSGVTDRIADRSTNIVPSENFRHPSHQNRNS